ncbi:MAG: hypothetical protein H6819_10320 [Phycisphaerales bacterium]|nr:hypothetical protein [Phycisphaerales bacterium]MCB9856610.1 hypothetical protein [Phycisphaerales bacterium]
MRKPKPKSGLFSLAVGLLLIAISVAISRLIDDRGVAYAGDRHAVILMRDDVVIYNGPIQSQVHSDMNPYGVLIAPTDWRQNTNWYFQKHIANHSRVIYPHDDQKYPQVPEGWLHDDGTPYLRMDMTIRESDMIESAKLQGASSVNVLPLGWVRTTSLAKSVSLLPGFQAYFINRRFAITFPLIIAAPFLLRSLYIVLRSRRLRRQNRCLYCAYCLDGIDSRACPECGQKFAP